MRTSLRNFTMLVSIKRILILSGIVSQLARCVPVFAQTIIPGGNVAGTWTAAGSPYLVQGDITVASSDTLNIGPGVDVLFQGFYRLTVSGILNAIGTASDSISFMPSDTVTGWRGLYINRSVATQHISYCDIEYAYQSGIQVQALLADAQVSHCTIAHCRNDFGGGILVRNHGKLKISHSTVAYNTAECDTGGYGGGIYIAYNTMIMDSCIVLGNRALIPIPDYHLVQGGGIYIGAWAVDVSISGSLFTDNFVGRSNGEYHFSLYYEGGGAISNGCTDDTVTISNCVIRRNEASVVYGGGGGIFLDQVARYTKISQCDISENLSDSYGSAVFAKGSAIMTNCTCYGNYCERAGATHWAVCLPGYSGLTHYDVLNTVIAYNEAGIEGPTSGLAIKHCDFLSGVNSYVPAGFGTLDRVNANGDSCDMYFNIFMDPMFADTANGNLHLQTGSPCIDAGDPTSPLDPDGTVADMGAYYYEHPLPIQLASFAATVIGQSRIRLEWTTASETNNYGFEAYRKYLGVKSTSGAFARRSADTSWTKVGFVAGHGTTLQPQSYSFIDAPNKPGYYEYRLKQMDLDGKSAYIGTIQVELGLPKTITLYQNYPNPFNPTCIITYALPNQTHVTLRVHDILGRVVQTLLDEMQDAGLYEVQLNASGFASGVYFYRLAAGSFVDTKKMLVLR